MTAAAGPKENILPYAAFLRGINVGGHRKVRMADLRAVFEAQGYANVKTVLASGNIRFTAAEADASALRSTIERFLSQEFGYDIPVLLRTIASLECLQLANPFKEVPIAPETRLYVTFLPEGETTRAMTLDDLTADGFTIVRATAREVCSVFTLSPKRGTIDLMTLLEREFGPTITTRTWNTITRLLAAR